MDVENAVAVFSRIRGNKILERFTVQDCNTPHSCDYRYNAIGYYLRHQQMVEIYLQEREQLAESVQAQLTHIQPDLQMIRSRLLSQH